MSTPRGIHSAPIPEWTVREQLVLASAVQRSGDQNWVSVSRAVRPLIEDAHPPEYFSQKNCALQYSTMLDKASTPKRKRSSDGTPEVAETAEEQIVRQLTEKRINELNQSLAEIKAEYLSLKCEIEQIEQGELDSQLPAIWEQIQMEIAAKEEAEVKAKEAAAASLKVKSPVSSQARQQEQPKPKAHKTPPSRPHEVGVARAAEAEKVKRAERAEQRQRDGGLAAVAKSGGKQNVAELKLPLDIKTEPIPSPVLSHPKLGTPTEDDAMSDEAPLPKLISTPKEEKYRLPMHVPQPSTEASLQQLSSDIHIIVQQPNTAMSGVGVAQLPLTTVSDSKTTAGIGLPSSSPHFAVAKIEHIQTPPATSKPLKMTSAMRVKPLPMSPEVKFSLLPQPTDKPAAIPETSIPRGEYKLPLVAKTVPPRVTDAQQGTVPSTQPPPPAPSTQPPPTAPLTQPPPPPPSTQPPPPPPSTQPPPPAPLTQPPPPAPLTQPPPPAPLTQSPLPASSTQPPPPAPSTLPPPPAPSTQHPPPTPSIQPPPQTKASPPTLPPTSTVTTTANVHTLASVITPTPPSPLPPMPTSPPHTTLPPAPPPLIPTPPPKESKPQPAKEQTAALPPASKVPPAPLREPAVQPQDSSKPVDRGAQSLEDKVREGDEKMTEGGERSVAAVRQKAEEQKVTEEVLLPKQAAKSEGKTKDVQGGSVKQDEPMETEEPLEAKPPVPPSKQEKPLSPKAPPLPPPPPLTPTIMASEAKSSRSGVRSPKSPLSPPTSHTRVTRTRSSRKEAGTADVTEQQQTQQREAAMLTPVEPKSVPSLKQEKLAPATPREVKKSAPATPREEKKLVPATPREEKKLAPATPRGEKKLAPATPKEEKKLAPATPKEEKKLAPATPKEVKKLAPATPREVKKLAPATLREEKKLAPATLREEKKPSPATPKEEKKPAPTTPKEEKKPSPATPKEEKKPSPATPKEEKKLAPATPREEKKLVPVTPREEEKVAPTTPREEEKLAPSTAKEEEEGGEEEEEEEEEETPIRTKSHKTPFKKQWITRSRKRKADVLEEGPSVESTDLESDEEPMSSQPSAVPSPAPSQSDVDPEFALSQKQWRKAIMLVWRHAAQHKYANLFLHPVKEDDAPGYRDVIFRPMDLSTIKKNVETGVTKTDTEFQRDMLLMFQNAFMYNSTDHAVHHMADEMRTDVMENIQDYLATQMQLMVETAGTKVLRSGGRREVLDESIFSPAKKRRTRADD